MSSTNENTAADITKLADLARDIRVAMMTTFPPGRQPHSRPMYTTGVDPRTFDGTLWFMSHVDSVKNDELAQNPTVLLTYAAPDKNRYVVVYGTARVEKNPQKAKELWNVHAKGWFPGGPEDPSLTLIRCEVTSAEYWDGPAPTSYLLSLLKAVATGTKPQTTGEHGKVTGR
ncbi:MAG TPA: pyridoxamine 5'-phosphate oxidase family protein [Caulifigura sp.]|nr:pyridoxamine 5'-phosphate oxidase family protein [Caulifigura sp.]